MTLAELKVVAKTHRPRIKQYYIKSKAELLEILSAPAFPERMRIEKMKLGELREEARKRKVPGLWKYRRAQLLEILYPRAEEHHQNDDGA